MTTFLLALLLFAVVVYTYAGYPLLLWVAARVVGRRERPPEGEEHPPVAILITMHNGRDLIADKLESLRSTDYAGPVSVNFLLDGATDGSEDEIARFVAEHPDYPHVVRAWPQPERNGKEAAIAATVPSIDEPILFFSDADATLDPDALRLMVDTLRRPGVGVVCGNEIHTSREATGAGDGQGLFYKYEGFVKRQQTRVTSLPYVQGGVFAMWRSLYPPSIRPGATQDGAIAFHCVLSGKRVAHQPAAVSREFYDLSVQADFARRVRTISRAMYAILCYPRLLWPPAAGLYGLHVYSSRVLRWMTVPIAVAATVLLIPTLVSGSGWPLVVAWAIIAAEIVFAGLAAIGWAMERAGRRSRLPYFCFYFANIHLAAALALAKTLTGQRVTTWKPTANVGDAAAEPTGEPITAA